MRIGALRVELQIPNARSLKEKRRPLKSLIARIQNKFTCAVAEVDHQDKHQRAAVGIAVVGSDGKHIQTMLQTIREFVEYNPDCAVLDIQEDIVDGPEPLAGWSV